MTFIGLGTIIGLLVIGAIIWGFIRSNISLRKEIKTLREEKKTKDAVIEAIISLLKQNDLDHFGRDLMIAAILLEAGYPANIVREVPKFNQTTAP